MVERFLISVLWIVVVVSCTVASVGSVAVTTILVQSISIVNPLRTQNWFTEATVQEIFQSTEIKNSTIKIVFNTAFRDTFRLLVRLKQAFQ